MTTEDAIGGMLKNEPVDRLVALDNDATEQAVDALQLSGEDENHKIRLYGEGCSEKAVYYLDQGQICTLVVPNEFYMGYESVASIARQLQYGTAAAERQIIDFLVVNRENLYDEDTQKILFPIVQ
jgi:ribose transport system substrate-binding protein